MPMHIHFILTMCLCSWRNSNDFSNSQSTRRELLCHPERMCNSSTPSQSVTCNPTACGTIAFRLQFILKNHTSKLLYVAVQCDSLLCAFMMHPKHFLIYIWILCNDFWSFIVIAWLWRCNFVFLSHVSDDV